MFWVRTAAPPPDGAKISSDRPGDLLISTAEKVSRILMPLVRAAT